MISHLELTHLPFVDDYPEADQKRIPWVRNGECLDGATTKFGSDGTLNGAPVAIQRNAEHLARNDEAVKESINVLIDNVNNINDTLEMGSDITTIQQIAQNKENIEILQVHMQFAEENIGDLYTDTEFLKEDVGVYDPEADPYFRPVRQDIVFLKNELGNYPDQDKNGFSAPGTEATGIKRRVINNSAMIVSNTERIRIMEENFQDSDIGSLGLRVTEIREELGPRTEGIGKPAVYSRLTSLENITDVSEGTINEIKDAIGLGVGPSINTRMNSAEASINVLKETIDEPITGLTPRMVAVEKAIGTASDATSINGRLATLRTDHNALAFTVGTDSSSGLRGQVAWLSETVGTTVNPAPASIQGRLATVTTLANETAASVQDLQAEIGTNKTGLKGSVLTLTNQMNGTDPNGTTIATRGVIRSVELLEKQMVTKLSDAPVDDQIYARQNATWVVAPGAQFASDIIVLQGDVAALKTQSDATDVLVGTLNTSMTSVKLRLDTVEEKVTKNTSDISTFGSDIESLKSDTADNKTKIETATTNISTIDGTLTTQGSDLSQAMLDIDSAQASIISIQSSIGELQVTGDANKTKIESIEAELVTIKADIAQLKTDVASKITDAPSEEPYVRVKGAWVPLSNYLP